MTICKICKRSKNECGKKDLTLQWFKQDIIKIGLIQKQLEYLNEK